MPATKAKNWASQQDVHLSHLFSKGKIAPNLEKKLVTTTEQETSTAGRSLKSTFQSKPHTVRRLKEKARAYCAEETAMGARKTRAEAGKLAIVFFLNNANWYSFLINLYHSLIPHI